LSKGEGCAFGMRERAVGDGHAKWGKEPRKGWLRRSGEWLLWSRLSHDFRFLECHNGRGTSQERHMWDSGLIKCLYRYRKGANLPGRCSESRSNRAEYPITKVQLGTEELR